MKWVRVPLADLSETIDYGVTASAKFNEGNVRFLRITDIQGNTVNWTTVPYCDAPSKKVANALLRDGDIVFARTGATTGKSYLLKRPPKNVVFASYLIRVRPSLKVDSDYLNHFFNTPDYWGQIKAKAQGAAQEGVNATKLSSLEIPLPPLDEQKRIAAILDKADALRRQRRQALALLDSLTQSIFLEMFGDPVSNPKGWKDGVPLSEVAEIVSGITKGRSTRGQQTRLVPYLAVANVQDRELDLTKIKYIEATEAEIDRLRLKKGDLLVTEGGDPDKLGRGTLWNNELPEAIHQNHIFRIRLSSSEITPLFASWLIGSERGKRYFLRSAKQTTGIASINKTQLSKFPLLRPPLELQLDFASRAESVAKWGALIESSRADAESLFASLQHRAFSGQL